MHLIQKSSGRKYPAALLRRTLALLALLAAVLAQPAMAVAPPLMLDNDSHSVQLEPSLEFLMDSTGQLTVDEIAQRPDGDFTAVHRSHHPYVIENGALWMRFDAVMPVQAPHWRLAIPMPTLDAATLYYRNQTGNWVRQQAGDTLPLGSWAQRGRYPVFDLSREADQSVRYYLQVRQARTPYSILPQIVSESEFVESRQNEHLLLGIYFGLATLVVALALFNAVTCRDAAFGIFALHVAMFAGTQGIYTGLAGLYLWPQWPAFNNAGIILMTLANTSAALWLARTICTPRRYFASLDLLMLVLIFVLPLAGVVDLFFSTRASFLSLNVLVGLGLTALVIGVGVALFEGDHDTRWVALGFSPILLTAVFPLLRNMGVISSGFWTEYSRMIASAIEVPIIFYGLHRRASQGRNLSARKTALRNTDPLTGVHATRVLLHQLRQSLATAERYQLPFALLLVNLTNLAQLQKQHGRETADRAMVLAAACIRGISHATDTVARVGDTQFALLLEGPINLDAANDVATRIIASGLRPSNELPDAEPLLFHVAVGHIAKGSHLNAGQAEPTLARMLKAVKGMNNGSRKAIRQVQF